MSAAYTTVEFMQQVMEADATNTTDAAEADLYAALLAVSRRVDTIMSTRKRRPAYHPYDEALDVEIAPHQVDSTRNTLLLDTPLLALSSVTLGSATLVVDTDVEVWPSTLHPPFDRLRLTSWTRGWYDYPTTNGAPLTARITGTWGYHPDYATAWQAVDTVQDDPLSDSATTLTVSDVDGADTDGRTPRIGRGDLLRLESEYLAVTGVDTDTNTATVKRGVNGTTAASHASGTSVEVWTIDEPLQRAVARQAAFQVVRQGSYTTTEVSGLGTEVRFPQDMLKELANVLRGYQWV